MKKKVYALLLFGLVSISLLAQNASVSGTVTEASTMEPLPGATIRIKDGTTGTASDLDGRYSIEAKQGDVLIFSLVGMKPVEKTVSGSGTINIVMDSDNTMLEQVVVIGYGTVKKSHLSGSVGSLTAKELNGRVATNAATALQGKIPGVSVSSTSGDPNAKMSISIRGISSLSNNEPLYIIDGAIGDINVVDPSDIESIEVLKDAAAAAIYGFRAAGGVVLISTKGGRKDTPTKLDLNIFTGFSTMNKKLKVFNGEEYSRFARYYNMSADGYGAGESMVPFVGKGTDWQDVMYNTAMLYKANMSLSGGSSTSTYNFSAGYLNKEGILRNTDHESYNVRLKNDLYLLNNRLVIGETLIARMSKGHGNVSETSTLGILQFPSVLPVFDETNMNGYATSKDLNSPNPYAEAYLFDKRKQNTEIFLNAYAQAEIIKGLKYKLNVGIRRDFGKERNYTHAYDLGTYGKNEYPDLSETSTNFQSWLLENTLTYDRMFGKHSLTALVGYSAQKDKHWGMYGYNSDIPDNISVMPGTGNSIEAKSYINEVALISQFARIMYSFDNRYLLSASIRRDGSSRFADGHRFGSFPSVSVAWNIHEEGFFKSLRNTVDQLKLRVSYGTLGNQDIGAYYPTQSVVSDNLNYLQGGNIWFGQLPYARPVSPSNLQWEKSETYNLGLDLSLWNGALTLTADAFIKNTNDILLPVPSAPSTGFADFSFQNAGQVRNTGVELAINHRGRIGKDFNYYVGANMTTGKNEVTKVTLDTGGLDIAGYTAHGAAGQGITRFSKGHSMIFFNLLETDGLFRSQEEIDNHRDKNGKIIQPGAQVGDVRYRDYNGDGTINTDDLHDMGSPFPDMTFGLRMGGDWKGLDFNLFFDGMTGNKIYNYPRYVLESSNYKGNHSTNLANSWRPDNQNTDIPRFSVVDGSENSLAYSNRWLEDGSYLRLKTLDIGYTLPAKWLKSIKLENVRVYTSMENLFTLTKYSGYTPDLGESSNLNVSYNVFSRGVDEGRYPQQRTISFGVQIKL